MTLDHIAECGFQPGDVPADETVFEIKPDQLLVTAHHAQLGNGSIFLQAHETGFDTGGQQVRFQRIGRVIITCEPENSGMRTEPGDIQRNVTGTTGALVGVPMGMGIAFNPDIAFKGGAVTNSNYHDYPLIGISEAPKVINVEFVGQDYRSTGIGEPGVPTTAPAIANAIFAATGKRLRELPIGNRI